MTTASESQASPSKAPFEGTSALITGGGTGMGKAIASALAELGSKVVVCGRRTEPLEATVAAITEAGGTAFSIPGDVANAKGCARLIEQSVDLLGGLDLLVNNAGVAASGPFAEVAGDDVDRVIDIDLKGPIHMTQAALPHLRAAAANKGGASVLNISSSVTQMALPNFALYSAAKAGVDMLTRCLALELAEHKIRVNALCPGVVRTPIFGTMMGESAADEFLDGFKEMVPIGRIGEPMDIARFAMTLLSPTNDWVTGAVIPIDGGLSLGPKP